MWNREASHLYSEDCFLKAQFAGITSSSLRWHFSIHYLLSDWRGTVRRIADRSLHRFSNSFTSRPLSVPGSLGTLTFVMKPQQNCLFCVLKGHCDAERWIHSDVVCLSSKTALLFIVSSIPLLVLLQSSTPSLLEQVMSCSHLLPLCLLNGVEAYVPFCSPQATEYFNLVLSGLLSLINSRHAAICLWFRRGIYIAILPTRPN